MVRAVRTTMPRIVTTRLDIFRMLAPKPRPPYEGVWHLWQVFVPRRSITGRLLWGTVLRRRDGGRIYKKCIQDNAEWEYRCSAGILVKESRK